METAEALAVLPPPTIFDMTQRINPINEETDACTFLRMCCTRKDINQDKDETNFVQIVLAIKTISPNIYIERESKFTAYKCISYSDFICTYSNP